MRGIMAENVEVKKEGTKKKKGGSKFRRIIAAIVILFLAVLFGMFAWMRYTESQSANAMLESGIKAKVGQLEGKSEAEIAATLNEVVDEGQLQISINMNPVFSSGEASGNLKIENHPNNHYNIRVSITMDDTGEEIYNSGLMPINSHIDEDVLEKVLKKGEYPATATFTAYDPETDMEVGQSAAKIQISILT